MDEVKITLQGDTMAQYEELKESLKNDPIARIKCLNNGFSFVQKFIAYNDEKVRYYSATYRLYFSKSLNPYLRAINSSSFSFNKQTKKITSTNVSLSNISFRTIEIINQLLDTEWFSNIRKSENYNKIPIHIFCNKTILEHIWGKKVTNPEDLIKIYSKRILQLKNITWSRVRKSLNTDFYFFREFFLLKIIDEYVDNPNLLIDKITSFNSDDEFTHLNDYRDYFYQIASLKIKSNVSKWSIRRLLEEHDKLSMQLMELEINQKDDKLIFNDIYNKYLPKNIRCRFINTERLCFSEGKSMSNCIYTNYWNSIRNLTYFAVSIDDNIYGRATLGITYRKTRDNELVFYVDQIRGPHNENCSEDLSKIMNEWVSNNQDVLIELKEKNSEENLVFTEKNDIFALENQFDLVDDEAEYEQTLA